MIVFVYNILFIFAKRRKLFIKYYNKMREQIYFKKLSFIHLYKTYYFIKF